MATQSKGKFSTLIIAFALILSCAFMFMACGEEPGGTSGSGSINIADDYNYEQINAKITELAGANGLLVKLHITSQDEEGTHAYDVICGAKDSKYYFKSQAQEVYLDFTSTTSYDVYTEDDGTWSKATRSYTQQFTRETAMATYSNAVIGYMSFYRYAVASEGTKSYATVAGRNCDKYSLNVSNLGANYTQEICIDKATGICLKYSASASYQGEQGSVSFECTQFSTNYNLVLPTVGSSANTNTGNGENNNTSGENGNTNTGNGENGNTNTGNGENGNTNTGNGENGNTNTGNGESGNTNTGNGENGNTNTGNGESGENVLYDDFIGKKLVVQSVACANNQVAAMLSTAYACFFSGGTFELVSDMGVLFGTITLSTNGDVASLTTIKTFDGDDLVYYYDFPDGLRNLRIACVNGVYTMALVLEVGNNQSVSATLTMVDSGEAPVNAVVPRDPNGGAYNSQYQVEQPRWDEIFQENSYLFENFTMTTTSQYVGEITYEVVNGIIHIIYANGNECYYEIGNEVEGGYQYNYYYMSNDNWVVVQYELPSDFFDGEMGIIPVIFANSTYSGAMHCYEMNNFTYTDYTDVDHNITRFRVYFENQNITSISITEMGQTDTLTFTKHGQTTVELPNVNGNHSQNVEDYYDVLGQKKLVFNRVTNGGGLTPDGLNEAQTTYQNATLCIFDDNEIEIYFDEMFNGDTNVAMFGTFTFTAYSANEGNPYVRGTIVFEKIDYDGDVQTQDLDAMNIRWYINAEQFRISIDSGDHFIYFELTDENPTHIANTGNGEGNNPDPGNEPGGNGGPNGNVANDDFTGKALVAQSVNCVSDEVAEMLSTAFASFFEDGTFELISDMGILFGTYTVSQEGVVASLTTIKTFDIEDFVYYYDFPDSLANLEIAFANDVYTMTIELGVGNNQSVSATITMVLTGDATHAVVPNDPNGGEYDPQYQVEQPVWDAIFQSNDYLFGNFTVTMTVCNNGEILATLTSKVDNGIICESFYNFENYYELGNKVEGGYECNKYIPDANDGWRLDNETISEDFFDINMGLIPAVFADSTYNSQMHYYGINNSQYTDYEGEDFEISGFRVYFEDQIIQSITFEPEKDGVTYEYIYTFTDYGQTVVELPEIQNQQI